MCFGCVTLASVVAVATPLVSLEVVPQETSSQKTISGFSGSTTTLSSQQKGEIKVFLDSNPSASSLTCTVFTRTGDSKSKLFAARNQSTATCKYAKQLLPSLRTSVSTKATNTRSLVGRISLIAKSSQTPSVNPVVPIVKPDPPQSTPRNPFAEPFPENFTKQQLVDAALEAVSAYSQSVRKSKPANLIFENTIPNSERIWMTKLVDTSMAVLPFTEGNVPVVIIGSSDSFINSALTQNGRSGYVSTWWCGSETTYERYCAGAGWAAMNYKDSIDNGLPITNSGKRAVVAHEIYHVWHKSIDGQSGNNNRDPNRPENEPLWFREGMANFFGFAIAHLDGATNYSEGRSTQVPIMIGTKPLKENTSYDAFMYGLGQAAGEYIVASVGVEKLFDVYRKLGAGKTFPDAFQESLGISLSDFYTKFEKVKPNFNK